MEDVYLSDYARWDPKPFIIQFGEGFGLRYYGLAYVLGFIIGGWLLKVYYEKKLSPFDKNQRQDIFLYIIIGVAVGGRLGYYVFYNTRDLFHEPWTIFQIWKGGMASHGGFIGIALTIWYTARKFKQPFWRVADLICTLAPAGLFLGRIANFLNGELWGKQTYFKFAVIFTNDPSTPLLPRHPSQLYEALLEGLVLLIYTQWRIWKTDILKRAPGRLVGEFLFGYAILRIFGEHFREPDADLIMGLSRGSFYSVILAIFAVFILWRSTSKKALSS
ncbi:MAG: prolipoprotein diacylglyceryl transferase [Verrucomicrobiota bacterium]